VAVPHVQLISSARSAVAVPHVQQAFNWDCGLACVLMVLRAAGVRGQDLGTLRALCRTTRFYFVFFRSF
jgi:Guanylylate cyclase